MSHYSKTYRKLRQNQTKKIIKKSLVRNLQYTYYKMENSFFIFTDKEKIEIERFHICTWEFKNSKPLIEFGAEISKNSIPTGDTLSLFFTYLGLQINVR